MSSRTADVFIFACKIIPLIKHNLKPTCRLIQPQSFVLSYFLITLQYTVQRKIYASSHSLKRRNISLLVFL